MGSIGPPFLEMLIIFPPLVSSVRELEKPLHIGMRCPQQPIIFYDIFYVWDIDFIGPFPISHISCLLLIMFPGGQS